MQTDVETYNKMFKKFVVLKFSQKEIFFKLTYIIKELEI